MYQRQFQVALRTGLLPPPPPRLAIPAPQLEKIRGKICRLGSKPALLRRLGPCVTKEELESLHQKNESVTRIFEKMLLFFLIFKKK